VLSLPYRLRYQLAWNHDVCRAVVGVFVPLYSAADCIVQGAIPAEEALPVHQASVSAIHDNALVWRCGVQSRAA
jgi:hypothetical protein